MQPLLSFDPYLLQLKKFKPSFSTYFTNHLAGMMHRYWYDYYPMEFKNSLRDISIFKKIQSMLRYCRHPNQEITCLPRKMTMNYGLRVAWGNQLLKETTSLKKFSLDIPRSF